MLKKCNILPLFQSDTLAMHTRFKSSFVNKEAFCDWNGAPPQYGLHSRDVEGGRHFGGSLHLQLFQLSTTSSVLLGQCLALIAVEGPYFHAEILGATADL